MSKDLYTIDNKGNLKFSLRSSLVKEHDKPDSIWECGQAVIAVMIICATLDTTMFYQLFSSYLADRPIIRLLSIIAMLVAFDLAPIYIGILLKKKSQGLKISNMLLYMLIFSFAIGFAWNIDLRLATKDLVLPDTTSTISFIGDVTTTGGTSNKLATRNALFSASLPLITSLVSFVLSYISSNPVGRRLGKLKAEQVKLEDEIIELEAMLLEYESNPDYLARMLEDDDQRYQTTLDIIQEQSIYYCDYVRERIKEHLADPASSNELSKNRRNNLVLMFNNATDNEDFIERKGA